MLKRLGKLFAIAVVTAIVVMSSLLGGCRWQASARESKTRVEAAPATGRFVHAFDTDVFIQEAGDINAPVVLFVHGMGAWSEFWRSTLDAVAADGFRAVAIDLPPFGYSERPAQKTYGRVDQARRILGVIDALGVRQVILVGHSFGGGPTLEAALMAPERMQRLVLADAAIGLGASDPEPGVASALLGIAPIRNALVAATVTNPRMTRRLLAQFCARQEAVTDARLAVLQAPLVVEGGTGAFGDWLWQFATVPERVLSKQPDTYARLTMPSLVIWGERDTTTPLEQGQQLARLIPRARLAVIPEVGHMPQIEDVEQFNRLLLEFLPQRQ